MRTVECTARLREDRMKHRPGQLSGKRILLAGVVGTQQKDSPRKPVGDAVAEPWNR